jgi:hypothetical protein
VGPYVVFADPEEKKRCLGALRDLELVDVDQAVAEAVIHFQIRP